MTAHVFTLDAPDGVPIAVHHWEPERDVRGVVHLVHGMAEHAGRYGHVADALTGAGFAVYAEDHRGHGRTATTDEDLGFLAAHRGWATVLDDLHRLTLHTRGQHPDVPLTLVGHSMGSFLAQQYLFTFPDEIDSVVLTGSSRPDTIRVESGVVLARMERARLGPRGRSPLLERVGLAGYNRAFEPARTPFDWLSRDPFQVDAYIADPRCGFPMTTQFYVDLASGVRMAGQVDRIRDGARHDLPILVLSGTDDPVGGTTGTTRLIEQYAAAGMTRVERILYDGGRHEIFNETNRDEVVGDLLGWLDARQAEHGS
jgi:alpha-beta hydrolase superfamily lysophospholipase